jgi:DNA-binding NarL/FixJ family response regulator
LSGRTVDNHVSAVLRKLGVRRPRHGPGCGGALSAPPDPDLLNNAAVGQIRLG